MIDWGALKRRISKKHALDVFPARPDREPYLSNEPAALVFARRRKGTTAGRAVRCEQQVGDPAQVQDGPMPGSSTPYPSCSRQLFLFLRKLPTALDEEGTFWKSVRLPFLPWNVSLLPDHERRTSA
jgi:hypothetical protein